MMDESMKKHGNVLSQVQLKGMTGGFFTLPNSIAEFWDNEKDDEWDKYL